MLTIRKAAEEDVYKDIARIAEANRLDSTGAIIPEGEVCKLSTSGRSVFVLIRGKGETAEAAVWLDERTRNCLGVSAGHQAEFTVERAGLIGQFRWAWNAAEPSYRVAARLAVVSVILGLIGLLLGGLSVFLAVKPPR